MRWREYSQSRKEAYRCCSQWIAYRQWSLDVHDSALCDCLCTPNSKCFAARLGDESSSDKYNCRGPSDSHLYGLSETDKHSRHAHWYLREKVKGETRGWWDGFVAGLFLYQVNYYIKARLKTNTELNAEINRFFYFLNFNDSTWMLT